MVLAHGSGWDEALFVAVPLVIVAALLVVANRRAGRLNATDVARVSPSEDPLDIDPDGP